MNELHFDNFRLHSRATKSLPRNYFPRDIMPIKISKIKYEKKANNFDQINSNRKDFTNTGQLFRTNADDSIRKSFYEKSFFNGNFNQTNFIANTSKQPISLNWSPNMNFDDNCYNKPSTAELGKSRPKEKLKKGQNQLIYERLLQKINLKVKENKQKNCTYS